MKNLPSFLIAATLAALTGCQQQRFAGVNPLGPVPAGILPTPTPNACPSNFSFEAGSPSGWSTTSWNFGLTGLVLDPAKGYCGSRSVKVKGNWGVGGDRNGYIQYEFTGSPAHYDLAADGTNVKFWLYASPALPAGTSVSVVVARAAGCGFYCWTSPYVGTVGNPPGNTWFQVAADYGLMGYTGLNDVQQILVNINLGGSAAYTGDIWFDEVDW